MISHYYSHRQLQSVINPLWQTALKVFLYGCVFVLCHLLSIFHHLTQHLHQSKGPQHYSRPSARLSSYWGSSSGFGAFGDGDFVYCGMNALGTCTYRRLIRRAWWIPKSMSPSDTVLAPCKPGKESREHSWSIPTIKFQCQECLSRQGGLEGLKQQLELHQPYALNYDLYLIDFAWQRKRYPQPFVWAVPLTNQIIQTGNHCYCLCCQFHLWPEHLVQYIFAIMWSTFLLAF